MIDVDMKDQRFSNMRIKTFGWQGYTGQIKRIEEGFAALGNKIVDNINDAELVYFNDRNFNDIDLIKDFKGIKIFNILDTINSSADDFANWKKFLNQADYITCISNTVKEKVKITMGIESKVIFNPIKDVRKVDLTNKIIKEQFLYVGRTYDPNKRFHILRELFSSFLKQENLAVCGTEDPFFAKYYGVVEDNILNQIYNSVDVVLLPSKEEGIGLSMIEAIVCEKMPICCTDNQTASEFLPRSFLAEPNSFSIFEKINDFFENKAYYMDNILRLKDIYKQQFDKVTVAKNILNLCN